MGAPACATILTAWFAAAERGTYWGMWNIAHNLGGFLAPVIVGKVLCSSLSHLSCCCSGDVLMLFYQHASRIVCGYISIQKSGLYQGDFRKRHSHGTFERHKNTAPCTRRPPPVLATSLPVKTASYQGWTMSVLGLVRHNVL